MGVFSNCVEPSILLGSALCCKQGFFMHHVSLSNRYFKGALTGNVIFFFIFILRTTKLFTALHSRAYPFFLSQCVVM